MENNVKTIKVKATTWTLLQRLKVKLESKNLNEVVEELIRTYAIRKHNIRETNLSKIIETLNNKLENDISNLLQCKDRKSKR